MYGLMCVHNAESTGCHRWAFPISPVAGKNNDDIVYMTTLEMSCDGHRFEQRFFFSLSLDKEHAACDS